MVVEILVCEGCGATSRDFVKPACIKCGNSGWGAGPWPSICKKCGGLVVIKCTRCGGTRLRKSPPFPFMA